MNPLAIPLPVPLTRCAQKVGVLTGLVCFPLSLCAKSFEGLLPTGPLSVVFPIVLLSALAGALAPLIADRKPPPKVAGASLRVGTKAGFIAALIAGALSVFVSTLHALGIGTPTSVETGFEIDPSFLVFSPTTRVILFSVQALPPSIFFALSGSLLTGMFRKNVPAHSQNAPSKRTARPPRGALFFFIIFLTAFCYLSPLLVFLKSEPEPASPSHSSARPAAPDASFGSPGFSAPPARDAPLETPSITYNTQPREIAAITSGSIPLTRQSAAVSDDAEKVRDFVEQHHQKASRGDVDGMIADYDDPVDYMSHGNVRREFIRADARAYHSPGTQVSEVVSSIPTVEKQQRLIVTTYSILFSRQPQNGKLTRGTADIWLKLMPTYQGLKIIGQHIKIRNSEEEH